MTHDHFTHLKTQPVFQFFSYCIPAIIGMLLTSGIVIIDGLFVGNIIGKEGLAAVNLTLPVLYFFLGVTLMAGVGGAVKFGHSLGAGEKSRAASYFSLTTALSFALIILLTILCLVFFDPLVSRLNTDTSLYGHAKSYLGTILFFYPAMMMNIVFTIFIRAEGKPVLSLLFSVAGNILNIFLDYLMITRLGLGLSGAALASGISVFIPMACAVCYFLSGRSVLRFVKFSRDWREMGRILFNGSSEMIGQFSIGITTLVFNRVILSRMGVDGVAAYTVAGYIAFFQMMIITGFAIGLGPIAGYSFGAGEPDHIRRVMKIAIVSSFLAGLVCWVGVLFSSTAIAALFSSGNETITALARSGFGLFSSAFLLNGFNILSSACFTAIGNARASLLISSLRGVLLINFFVLVLPVFTGDSGIWLSYPLSELVTLFFSIGLLHKYNLFPKILPVLNFFKRG